MHNRKLFFWALTSALAGFLFGFDTIVISGAEQKIQSLWNLNSTWHVLAISAALLGTVLGLIHSFSAVGVGQPEERQKMLALGISEALHHTAMGLSIAVLAIISHLILNGMAKKVVADLELFAMRLENFLAVNAATEAAAENKK